MDVNKMKSVNTYLDKLFNPYFWFGVGLWAWIFELDKIFSSIAICIWIFL